MKAHRFLTASLQDGRIARILDSALDAVEPGRLVRRYLAERPLPPHDRLFLLGIGKAAEAMTVAAMRAVGNFDGGLIVTKSRAGTTDEPARIAATAMAFAEWPQLRTMEAGHPIPDERSAHAGSSVLEFVSGLSTRDLLLCLISGGASALVTAPAAGVTLTDLQSLTASLLASGANIEQVNTVRRQIDRLKGGGLAAATRAGMLSLILSDVLGDSLSDIASGPTTPNPTTGQDAIRVLESLTIEPTSSVLEALQSKRQSPPERAFDRVLNVIIGNNRTALEGARRQAALEGFRTEILRTDLQGEAAEAGRYLAGKLRAVDSSGPRPFCLISGGETTVTLDAKGKGGRNQELALAAVDALDGLADVLLVSLGTDGNDGPTDAAGAVVTGETARRASLLHMNSGDYLARHVSYSYFDALGDLLRSGYTGTNVNDLMLLVGL